MNMQMDALSYIEVLIETYWNVNVYYVQGEGLCIISINRNILECK